MKHHVYLAGPITGLTFNDGQGWRTYAARALDSEHVITLSPLRGKEYLKVHGKLTNGTYDGTLTSAKAITRRDFFDCTRATAVLVNLEGTERLSIGTIMEIAWAYQAQIPTVVVCPKNNPHHHVLLDECCTYQVETLEEAITVMKVLLGGYDKERL